MRTFRRPLYLSLAALGIGLALTGCTGPQDPTSQPGSGTPTSGAPERTPASDNAGDDEASSWTVTSPLVRAWLDDDPTGTGPQIALRFLQAVQDHDDLAADRELYGWERFRLADRDLEFLRSVMNDVRANAQLDDAGPCRDADWTDSDHVAVGVDCGLTTVVVRVWDDAFARGVRIADGHGHSDDYPGPHTHAQTNEEL